MSTTNAIERRAADAVQTKTDRPTFVPSVDMLETHEEFRLYADLPGATAENVDITFDDGLLAIHASIPPRGGENAKPVLQEYGVGDYHREFRLGENIDVEQISATVSDGVLSLVLPKTDHARRRRIEIKNG